MHIMGKTYFKKQKNGINMHCLFQKLSSEKSKFFSLLPYPMINTHPKKASLIINRSDSKIK